MSCEHEEYNGWSNRETWAAALMIDNDEGMYMMSRELLADLPERSVYHASQALEEWIDELCEELPGFELAWLKEVGSTWRIDWHEIALAWIAEHAENNPEETEGDDR